MVVVVVMGALSMQSRVYPVGGPSLLSSTVTIASGELLLPSTDRVAQCRCPAAAPRLIGRGSVTPEFLSPAIVSEAVARTSALPVDVRRGRAQRLWALTGDRIVCCKTVAGPLGSPGKSHGRQIGPLIRLVNRTPGIIKKVVLKEWLLDVKLPRPSHE